MKTYSRIFLTCLLIFVGLHASAQTKFKRRGRFVKEEIEKKEEAPAYAVSLEQTNGSIPVLLFKKQTDVTIHTVRMYETILEIAKMDTAPGPVYREQVEPQVVPGELMPGEHNTTKKIIDGPPFANETFQIEGHEYTTDKDGQIKDLHQKLLVPLDNLSCNSYNITIYHPQLGEKTITITRNLLKKPTTVHKAIDEKAPPAYDILDGLGLDFTQLRQNSQDGLAVSYNIPKSVKAGETVNITVEIANSGTLPIGTVLVRTFSREPWLDGKFFYFGNIHPGRTATFTREFTVPENSKTEISHVAFATWNILGSMPDKTQTFKITRQ